MSKSKVISSDSHVVEPPNVWMERMDQDRFGSRIPHMVNVEDIDAWIVDNKETGGVGAIAQAGLRFDRPEDIVLKGAFDDVAPERVHPNEHGEGHGRGRGLMGAGLSVDGVASYDRDVEDRGLRGVSLRLTTTGWRSLHASPGPVEGLR